MSVLITSHVRLPEMFTVFTTPVQQWGKLNIAVQNVTDNVNVLEVCNSYVRLLRGDGSNYCVPLIVASSGSNIDVSEEERMIRRLVDDAQRCSAYAYGFLPNIPRESDIACYEGVLLRQFFQETTEPIPHTLALIVTGSMFRHGSLNAIPNLSRYSGQLQLNMLVLEWSNS